MLTHEKLHKLLVEELAREDLPPTKNILRIASIGMYVLANNLSDLEPAALLDQSDFERDETGFPQPWGLSHVEDFISEMQRSASYIAESYFADHIDHV